MSRRVAFLILLIQAVVMFTACEPESELVTSFVIPSGEHYSTPRMFESLQSNKLHFKARFNETAIYDLGNIADQNSKNKLLGFSDCNAHHHENSARFAWQWFNNELQIYAYCYLNGIREERFLGTVHPDEFNDYSITLEDDFYVFRLNQLDPVKIDRTSTCDKGLYYILWPYFGGSMPAPHDISVDIKILY
jgi:hypothetical protein